MYIRCNMHTHTHVVPRIRVYMHIICTHACICTSYVHMNASLPLTSASRPRPVISQCLPATARSASRRPQGKEQRNDERRRSVLKKTLVGGLRTQRGPGLTQTSLAITPSYKGGSLSPHLRREDKKDNQATQTSPPPLTSMAGQAE